METEIKCSWGKFKENARQMQGKRKGKRKANRRKMRGKLEEILREIKGNQTQLPLELPVYSSQTSLKSVVRYKSAFEVNVLEEKIREITGIIEFKPYEVKFIKLEF